MEVMPEFNLLKPRSLEEASGFAREHADARFLAGGTDLIVNLRRGIGEAKTVIDLSGIEALKEIKASKQGAQIGAGVTLSELADHAAIAKHYPVVAEAARAIAGPTHQRFATVGGNLCLDTRCIYYNQSHWWRKSNDYCLKYKGTICHVAPKSKRCFAAFSGDLAPAMLLFDAQADLLGPDGGRTIPLTDLYREDGADHLTLGTSEFLVSVSLPAPGYDHMGYEKVRIRDAIDFPLVGAAVGLARKGDKLTRLAVAFTGTNSQPIAITGLEEFTGKGVDDDMLERLERIIAKQIKPMKSTSAPSTYRRAVATKLAVRTIRQLWRGTPRGD